MLLLEMVNKMFVFLETKATYTTTNLLEVHIVPQLLLYDSWGNKQHTRKWNSSQNKKIDILPEVYSVLRWHM